MSRLFQLDLLDQGWLVPSEPDGDLCSHGHLRLTIGGVEVADGCGTILMMGCPIGLDFSVEHEPGVVKIGEVVRYDSTNESQATQFPGLTVEVSEAEYRHQVVGSALRARELFVGTTKQFDDDFDANQYQGFWAEFDRLLAGHRLPNKSLQPTSGEKTEAE